MRAWMKLVAGAFVASLVGVSGASAQAPPSPLAQQSAQMPHPGAAIYRLRCATCHENPEETKAPSRATLSAMSYQVLSFALTQGKMQAQAAGLSEEDRGQLINYLTGRSSETRDTWSAAMACPGEDGGREVCADRGHVRLRRAQHPRAEREAGGPQQGEALQAGPRLGDRLPGRDHDAGPAGVVVGKNRLPAGGRGLGHVRLRRQRPGEALRAVGLPHARRRAAADQRRLWRRSPTARPCWPSRASTPRSTWSTRAPARRCGPRRSAAIPTR